MGMLCLVSIKFEFIWLEGEIGSRHVAPERRQPIAGQLARRLIAAVGTLLLEGKIGRRAPTSCREEVHRAWRAPSAGQPHDNAARDKRGAAVPSMS
jgi:hypothetical protein